MKTSRRITSTIAEIGLFAAIGFVLDEVQGMISKGLFVNGGSIGFALIAVVIIGYRRGFLSALLTGLIMGLLDIATSAFIIHPAQLFLDYILPYAFVAVSALFVYWYRKEDKKNQLWILMLSIVAGGLMKFLSHYLAGVIFWADQSGFAWDLNYMNPNLYSAVYNIAFMGPSIVLSCCILAAIQVKAPQLLVAKTYNGSEETLSAKPLWITLSSVLIACGLTIFVLYLIKYINSYDAWEEAGTIDYDFNPDSMIIMVTGFFIATLGVYDLVASLKNRLNLTVTVGVLDTIAVMNLLFGIARLIRMHIKVKPTAPYWWWLGITTLIVTIFTALFVYMVLRNKRIKNQANLQD